METSSAESKLANAKTIVSAAASLAASVMLFRSMAQELLPDDTKEYVFYGVRKIFNRFSSAITIVIDEYSGLASNEVYEAAEIYLGSKISPYSSQRFKVSKPENEKELVVTMDRNEEMVDTYNGVKFKWVLRCIEVKSIKHFYDAQDLSSSMRSEIRYFELTFSRKHKDMVLKSYLPHIVEEAKSLKEANKTIKLFTVEHDMYGNMSGSWISVKLDHPSTFETLAMDSDLKKTILKDLEMFIKRKEHYRKVGKAWKRGYLLYGPPGTGKSSLIAAMANYLNFDVYDLDLTDIKCNSELRRLLIATANRSILVLEDIDCTIDQLKDRNMAEPEVDDEQPRAHNSPKNKVTLSGVLNFVDGLWSSCGDERIIVFTTNHKDKLDPALLRPGRMDVHVHMSYCTPCGFRTLASNYLGIKDHELFREIEEAIRTTQVTPAEIAEQLLRSDDLEAVLQDLIEFLKAKKIENEQAKEANGDEPSSQNH
ncbi:hypothetical protein COLO4_22026 [Corchorus olitorius]|uniref:AAA+ ATPase domain-containing protein n=1 Tax=Corchorus olitorius TaxID=93759 RepID=A0A1R3IPH4_9ROSI|nr:hypothetical protein COLO4_22026 [Corchorus olitorius]